MGYYNEVKHKVKQQLQIRYSLKIFHRAIFGKLLQPEVILFTQNA